MARKRKRRWPSLAQIEPVCMDYRIDSKIRLRSKPRIRLRECGRDEKHVINFTWPYAFDNQNI